jgi:anti-sigma factor RsiW
MTCQEAIALLVDHLEATLDDEQRARLERHLAGCAPCVAYLRTYRRTRDVVAAEGRAEMPEEMKARLRAFLLEEMRKSAPG